MAGGDAVAVLCEVAKHGTVSFGSRPPRLVAMGIIGTRLKCTVSCAFDKRTFSLCEVVNRRDDSANTRSLDSLRLRRASDEKENGWKAMRIEPSDCG